VTPEDDAVIRECLRAAVEGPFFPDWEFDSLVGMSRDEVAQVSRSWPETSNPSDQDLAVNNVLANLCGYPHGVDKARWSKHISVSSDEVREVLRRWQSSRG